MIRGVFARLNRSGGVGGVVCRGEGERGLERMVSNLRHGRMVTGAGR